MKFEDIPEIAKQIKAEIRAEVIDECKKSIHDYFGKLIEDNSDWELDSIEDYALIPNKEICMGLEKLKEQKNE